MASAARAQPSGSYLSLPDGTLALVGLAGTAGIIHVVAAIEHVSVSWMFGVFFSLVGAGQLSAGWWIYRPPEDRRVLSLAAVCSVLIALLWVFSRTTGLPFGPDAGNVSTIGVADTSRRSKSSRSPRSSSPRAGAPSNALDGCAG